MKYFLLTGTIQEATEKAIGVAVGWNHSITNSKIYIEWIARKIIKEADKNIYIPAWLVAQNSSLKDQVDYKNFLEVAEEKKVKKPRKTKEEKELEYYSKELNNRFNGEIPSEYIEFYYGEDDLRFTDLHRLAMIEKKEEVTKIVIVRDGQKEVVRG
jgi:hypothetical protein